MNNSATTPPDTIPDSRSTGQVVSERNPKGLLADRVQETVEQTAAYDHNNREKALCAATPPAPGRERPPQNLPNS